MRPDTSRWTQVDSTPNAELYVVEPGVLAVVPHDHSRDDETTARQNVAAQLRYLRAHGLHAGVVVFMDGLVEQDAKARAVYRHEPDPVLHRCFALVGLTPFGRAAASFFIGLHRPKVPTRFFATQDEALAWVREVVRRP